MYGRAVLPEALSESAQAYGLHPALLDAALHVLGLVDAAGVARVSDGSLLLPFAWSEVSLLATGARELRVRASVERGGAGEALAELQLADGSGRAVARVGGLRLREASEAQIREAARSEVQHLYRLDWRPVALSAAGPEALTLIVGGDGQLANRLGHDWVESVAAVVARLEEGGARPARVVFDHLAEPASSAGDFLAVTHAGAERALSELQFILSDARLTETSVAWLTSGALATGPEEGVTGLSRAPLWGLVRSARAEHPDRQLQLLDVDAAPAEAALLARLLAAAEPELALRHGSVLAPRLVRAARMPAGEPRRLEPDGTVLITGGAGELGRGAGAAPGRSSRRAPPASDVTSGTGDAGSGGVGGGTAGPGCADGAGGELRRVGSGLGAIGIEQHSGGAAVDGCVSPGGGAGRRDCFGADGGATGACAAAEAGWWRITCTS